MILFQKLYTKQLNEVLDRENFSCRNSTRQHNDLNPPHMHWILIFAPFLLYKIVVLLLWVFLLSVLRAWDPAKVPIVYQTQVQREVACGVFQLLPFQLRIQNQGVFSSKFFFGNFYTN